jgi:hypothetical protein
MESEPNLERRIEKSELTELIKGRGLTDPAVMELVQAWTTQQEEQVTGEDTPAATIRLNIERADLYLAAGDKQGALEVLDDARFQAHQENEDDLYRETEEKMSEIEG